MFARELDMKKSFEKRFNRSLLAASITSLGMAAPAAFADESDDEIQRLLKPESKIEIGIGTTSGADFKFGDYTGLGQSRTHAIANLHLVSRGENDARWLEIVGRNLGLDSRSLKIEGGQQGSYGLRLEYSELPKLTTDSYHTPYNGAGSTRLTQPPGLVDMTGAAPNTNNIAGLAANMKPFDVESKRKAFEFGLTKLLPASWDVVLNYKRENKDGTKLTGIPLQFAAAGGSRGTALAPEPISYVTDQFEAIARYYGTKFNFQAGYYASIFRNANDSLTFDSLYEGAAPNTRSTGRNALPPDNQFHQLNASGSYTFTPTTRLSGALSFGRMTQNETFLPYTTSLPTYLGGVEPTTAMTGSPASLNGKIDTTHLSLKFTSKLTSEVGLNAGYRFDKRDNKTARNLYGYINGDGTGILPVAGSNAATWRWNTPLDSTKQALNADLDFHLTKATKLKLGYDFHHVEHNYEPTPGDKEHTVKAELKHQFNETVSGGMAYAYSDRDAGPYVGYEGAWGYTAAALAARCDAGNSFNYMGALVACTAAGTTGKTTPFFDTPALQKFFLADRKRDKLHAFANFMPSQRIDLQLSGNYVNDNYPDAANGYGLAKAKGWSTNLDAGVSFTDEIRGTFFTSYESMKTKVRGHHNSTVGITAADREFNTPAFIALNAGEIYRTDNSLTVGLGLRVNPGGNYEWGADMTHSRSIGKTDFGKLGTAAAAQILPMPDTLSRINRLEVFGKYHMQKDLSFNLRYVYENFHSKDWAWDGQTYTSSQAFIGTGMSSPDYKVHLLGASISYRFH